MQTPAPVRTCDGPKGHARTDMLLPLLKAHTAEAHARLERVVPLMRDDLTLEAYRAHLLRLHAFYARVEPQLASAVEQLGLDPAERLKLPRLREDLAALGEAVLPPGAEGIDAPLGSFAGRVGALYVLEGSTLGGQLISRHLRRVLPEAAPFRFLDPYGAQTGPQWRAFCAAAERTVPESAHGEAAAAAKWLFESLEGHLTEGHRSPAAPP